MSKANKPFSSSCYLSFKTSLDIKPCTWKKVLRARSLSDQSNSFPYDSLCTRTRFEKEATRQWLYPSVLWLDITTLGNWLKNLAPLCPPIRSTIRFSAPPRFPALLCWALRLLHVFSSNSDWFTALFTGLVLSCLYYYCSLTSLLSSSKLTLNVGSSRANRLRAFENCAKSF